MYIYIFIYIYIPPKKLMTDPQIPIPRPQSLNYAPSGKLRRSKALEGEPRTLNAQHRTIVPKLPTQRDPGGCRWVQDSVFYV